MHRVHLLKQRFSIEFIIGEELEKLENFVKSLLLEALVSNVRLEFNQQILGFSAKIYVHTILFV